MIRSYRYRLKPNVAQKMFFIKTFGCVRYINVSPLPAVGITDVRYLT